MSKSNTNREMLERNCELLTAVWGLIIGSRLLPSDNSPGTPTEKNLDIWTGSEL